ncbi:GFA family protein [Aspergillus affinis]|uniref:GFA family protein n=1 Tax=Aspergillus affinis TaxID=1070780 RepID=UPI0022FDFA96|nr:Mss4-like protein [Aspergillus affinis]KAI9042840.1 Mss4-like protein [Aspergillus affinis]
MSTNLDHPSHISGGCLCGAIRYTIDFSDESSWPPKSSTCQCTMCRKFTASIYPQLLALSITQVTPHDLSTFETYKEYRSSEKCLRGFCFACGSSLIFRSEEEPNRIHIFLGTVDEEALVGEKVAGSDRETEFGVVWERKGGVGNVLATPNSVQLYWENVIPGVSDLLKNGERLLADVKDGRALG